MSGDIKIEFYDDRVMIFSPGSLPNGLTLENIKMGMVAKRNEIIVNALDKLDLIENYASGVRRIFDDYMGFEKQPDYYISDNGVILTLYNRNYKNINTTQREENVGLNDLQNDKNVRQREENVGLNEVKNLRKLSPLERQKKIVELMKENKNMTAEILRVKFNVSLKTIERDIVKLRQDNKIEYIGRAKNGYWVVKG